MAPLKKSQQKEKQAWLSKQVKQRSYFNDVVTKIELLKENVTVKQYGTLDYADDQFPLYAITSLNWDQNKPCVLITGGVHGYETSGVIGALKFIKTEALQHVF